MRWSIANAAAGAVIAPVALMVRARLIEDIETSSFSAMAAWEGSSRELADHVECGASIGGGRYDIALALQARPQKAKNWRFINKNPKRTRCWRHGRASVASLFLTGIGSLMVKTAPDRSINRRKLYQEILDGLIIFGTKRWPKIFLILGSGINAVEHRERCRGCGFVLEDRGRASRLDGPTALN